MSGRDGMDQPSCWSWQPWPVLCPVLQAEEALPALQMPGGDGHSHRIVEYPEWEGT